MKAVAPAAIVVVESDRDPVKRVVLRVSVRLPANPSAPRLVDEHALKIAPTDDAAATLSLAAWESGLISGAFHGARQSGMSPSELNVQFDQVEAVLGAGDVTALAVAASAAVETLFGGRTEFGVHEGWRVLSVSLGHGPNP